MNGGAGFQCLRFKKTGVAVTVILDKSQRTERYSSADFLAHAGVLTYIDAQHAIARNKVMLIDSATIVTGSFNFTRAAQEKNAEKVLILNGDQELMVGPQPFGRLGHTRRP